MIVEYKAKSNICGRKGSYTDTQYFGKDAIKFNAFGDTAQNIYKECETEKGRGIIIGVENSETFMDVYYIIYIPNTGETVFELVNNASFTIYE